MKAREWQKYLEEQRRLHGKLLFTVTELANVANTSRSALNVELARLIRQGVVLRYAHGQYGLPDAVTPGELLPVIDPHAYITGSYALHLHNLITQVPARISCFTDRRSPRAQERNTPVGRFVFICVHSAVYVPPVATIVAAPAQALCDFVYMTRRQGVSPEGLVTFRPLAERVTPELDAILGRYPVTVQEHVRALVAGIRNGSSVEGATSTRRS
jgi:predicted transcriptional regulator of viral defense system